MAKIIDKVIHQNYKLHPVNYFAYDAFMNTNEYEHEYEGDTKLKMSQFFESILKELPIKGQTEGRAFLLKMYANPLINAKSYLV